MRSQKKITTRRDISWKRLHSVFLRSIRSVFGPPLAINSLDADQFLLFEGSQIALIWDIQSACYVKLYLNNIFYGSYLPGDIPVVPVQRHMKLSLQAFSLFRSVQQSAVFKTKALKYHESGIPLIDRRPVTKPRILIETPVLILPVEPITPGPTIHLRHPATH